MLEDQQRLKKVSNSVFTTKIDWGALSWLSSVFWIWICTQNWCFEFEFAFEFGTYILHIPWSRSETNDLSMSVRTFFENRTPCYLPLSPCKRDIFCCHNFSAEENDRNASPACGKAITYSPAFVKGSYFTFTSMSNRQIQSNNPSSSHRPPPPSDDDAADAAWTGTVPKALARDACRPLFVINSDEFLNTSQTWERAETGPHGKFAGVGLSGCLLFLFLVAATDNDVVVIVVVVRCGDASSYIFFVRLWGMGMERMEGEIDGVVSWCCQQARLPIAILSPPVGITKML